MVQAIERRCTRAEHLVRWSWLVATTLSVILATDVAYAGFPLNGLTPTPDFRNLTGPEQDIVAEDELHGPCIATVTWLPIHGVSA